MQGVQPTETGFNRDLCADMEGFRLRAAVRCGANDREVLEQLCHIKGPALANERVQSNPAGQVVLELKSPWRDGTAHLVASPLELMPRLAALAPLPRRPDPGIREIPRSNACFAASISRQRVSAKGRERSPTLIKALLPY